MDAVIIEKEAMQLPECERAVLADRLLASIARKPVGMDDCLLREADERMKAFHDGKIVAVNGPEALAKIRRDFPR